MAWFLTTGIACSRDPGSFVRSMFPRGLPSTGNISLKESSCRCRHLEPMKMDGHELDRDHQSIVDEDARTRSQAPYFRAAKDHHPERRPYSRASLIFNSAMTRLYPTAKACGLSG